MNWEKSNRKRNRFWSIERGHYMENVPEEIYHDAHRIYTSYEDAKTAFNFTIPNKQCEEVVYLGYADEYTATILESKQ